VVKQCRTLGGMGGCRETAPLGVMPGFMPGIHVLPAMEEEVDGRDVARP
jgi:hypothetical protein